MPDPRHLQTTGNEEPMAHQDVKRSIEPWGAK